jgi:hypothetical protein
MSVSPILPQPRPTPGEDERLAVVYVLREHVNGRSIHAEPLHNAAERDLTAIYAQNRLIAYPDIRDRFEQRQLADADAQRKNRAWALAALDAIYSGRPVPGRRRPRFEQCLRTLVDGGQRGATRKEVCRRYGVDGGKVSGALSTLHAAGICFPLVGVKR